MPSASTAADVHPGRTRRASSRLIARLDGALLLIVLLGAGPRFLYVGLPLAEAHRWRQITNADIARNFHERSLDPFHPQVSWGGPADAYVGMEFPLMHVVVALLYRLFGEHEIFGRLVSIAFSVGTIVLIYLLGRRLFGAAAGRGAAFLMAVSPTGVFFGRTFLSDTPMLFFSVAAVLAYVAYLDQGRGSAAVIGSISLALACLVKIPAVIVLAPIAWAAWEARRWQAVSDWRLIGGIACALAATAAWYWHADNLYHQTGLGQAIWHPSGTYGAEIAVSAGPMTTVSHWSTLDRLGDAEFYREIVRRLWYLHLTPAGFALALLGFATAWRRPRRLIVDAWLGAVVLFILAAAEGNFNHEFHQLPILPPAALFFGIAAAPAFDGTWLRAQAGSRAGIWTAGAALLVVGLLSFNYSGVVDRLFRPRALDFGPIAAGIAISRVVDPASSIITVEYERFGNNSPILLYRAHRRGWSFDLQSIRPHVIERLKTRSGAAYFATTLWSRLKTAQPEVAAYLQAQTEVPLPGAPPDTVLFELRYRPGGPGRTHENGRHEQP